MVHVVKMVKSLMAERLRWWRLRVIKWIVHVLDTMDSNSSPVELGAYSTFVRVVLEPMISIASKSVHLRSRAFESSDLEQSVEVHFVF